MRLCGRGAEGGKCRLCVRIREVLIEFQKCFVCVSLALFNIQSNMLIKGNNLREICPEIEYEQISKYICEL